MLDKIINLAKELIEIKSDPDNLPELNRALERVKSELVDFTIEEFESEGSKSILVYNLDKRPDRFRVILNGHLDVIPGKDYQYQPKIEGDNLYGVGSLDMKSSVACLITVFKEVVSRVDYPLGLQIVTDEEIGGINGTKYQIDQGVKTELVIAGESTNFQIANKAKGVLQIKIVATGKTAHGAYPWRGENAILKMNKFLDKLLKKFPNPTKQEWVTTVNLSRIETSNRAFNKIPDDCSASLDIRFVPEDKETVLEDIKNLLPDGVKMEIIENEPALDTPSDLDVLQTLQKITEEVIQKEVAFYGAQGTSDARHFTRVGLSGIEFGPVGQGIGSDEESVSIKSLEQYAEILTKFLLSIKK